MTRMSQEKRIKSNFNIVNVCILSMLLYDFFSERVR